MALADDAHYIAGLLILGIRAAHKKINQLKIGALKEMHVLTLPLLVKLKEIILYKGSSMTSISCMPLLEFQTVLAYSLLSIVPPHTATGALMAGHGS